MKLSTKELFTPSKKGPKKKLNNIHKLKIITHHDIINKTNKNQKRELYTVSLYKNPFREPKFETSQNSKSKKKIVRKSKINNISKLNLDIFQTSDNILEDSVCCNDVFAGEENSNKYEYLLKEQKIKKIIENDDKFFPLFQKSNFKKTIIIDKKGNNNLNIPKKFFFQEEKYKKNKNIKKPINNKPKKEYFSTNLLLTFANKKNKNVLKKNKNNTTKNINDDFRENKGLKIQNILYKKLFSTEKYIQKDSLEINNGKNKKGKEEKKVPEDSSIFEDYTYKSLDSSFLGSSLGENFYKYLNDKKE